MPSAIKQRGDAQPTWFSIKEGRDQGSPLGGWTTDPVRALQFARPVDATEFMQAFLPHQAPNCEVGEVP